MDQQEFLIYVILCAFVGICTYYAVWIFSKTWEEYQKKYLAQAGQSFEAMYLMIPVDHLLYLSLLAAVLITVFAGFIISNFILGLALGVTGFFFPNILVHILRTKRRERFEVQLVDALENVKSSIQAGLTLPQAFDVLVQEMPDPLSQEFRVVTHEIRLGRHMDEALKHLVERMPIDDLRITVNAINTATELGGDLPRLFDVVADTIRERFQITEKLMAATSQGRLQGLVLTLLPPFLGLVIHLIDPHYMEPLYTTFVGAMVIVLLIIMDLLGYILIRHIMAIDI